MNKLLSLLVVLFPMLSFAQGTSIRSLNGVGTNTLFYSNTDLVESVTGTTLFSGAVGSRRSIVWNQRILFDTLDTQSMDWDLRTFNGTAWKFLTMTNHTDMSAAAYVANGLWAYNGAGVWTNGLITSANISGTLTPAKLGSITNHTDMSAAALVSGGVFAYNGATGTVTNGLPPTQISTNALVFGFDGAGAVIPVGSVSYGSSDKKGTIIGWEIIAKGTSPTCTFDLWRVPAGTALPVVGNTLMGTKPALVTGNVLRSTVLTAWTSTAITVGDIFGANVDAAAVATNIIFKIIYTSP